MVCSSILFICTGNTCRSPMAEMIARHIFKEQKMSIQVSSAGLATFDEQEWCEHDLTLAKEYHWDVGQYGSSRQIRAEMIQANDLILTMTEQHLTTLEKRFFLIPDLLDKSHVLKSFLGIDDHNPNIRDPYGGSLQDYRNLARELSIYLEKLPQIIKD